MDANISAATTLFFSGGCVVTTGNYVCISHSFDANSATPPVSVHVNSLNNRWIAKKDWKTTEFVAGTAITLAKWQMVFTGTLKVCTLATIASANQAACVKAGATTATGTGTMGMNYYQPKETSDKVYVGLPRFSKGETMKYIGL